MPSEYGYGGDGSVLGGIGQLIQMKDQQDKLDQQKAALPFLNHVLSQYTQGQSIPNLEALSSFVNSREGLSRSGVNDASATNIGSETNARNAMLPGQVAHQGLENEGLGQENQIRAGSLQDLIAAPGVRNDYERSEIGKNQADTTNTIDQGRFIAPEAQARIGSLNASTNAENTKSSLAEPEFDLDKAKLQYQMSDPNNEGELNSARARNFDAETKLYSNPGSTGEAIPGSGIDPKTRQAVLDALSGGGSQQKQNAPLYDKQQPNFLQRMIPGLDPDNIQAQTSPQEAQQQSVQQNLASSKAALDHINKLLATPGLGEQQKMILGSLHDRAIQALQGGQ